MRVRETLQGLQLNSEPFDTYKPLNLNRHLEFWSIYLQSSTRSLERNAGNNMEDLKANPPKCPCQYWYQDSGLLSVGPIKKQRNSVLSQIFLYSWGAGYAPVSKAGTFVGTSCNFQHRKMLFHLILKFLPWNFEMVGEQFSSPSVLQEVSPTLFFKEMRSCNKSVTLSHSLKLRRWDVWIRSKAGLDTAPCTPRGGNGCSV